MTTMTQQLTQGSLRLRPASPSSGQNPQAWKDKLGTKPVSARFALLPETKPKMSALGTSVVVQICLVAFVVTIPLLFPQQMCQGWFEVESLVQKQGKTVVSMIQESTPANRREQLTMNLELEFRDEFGERRKLPNRRHYFDFDRWAWIPHLSQREQ